ncbi:MFS transporter [Actinomadura logoneensis]|uniref:MFS transporter n=1 Tax=Actinomadura logoneensis TaxID=2293572 RepID=A0A372JJL7_9ACTN|nr:MFS transporter [Actinomadura logoneensis]RFU39498.1 MFS transporter [Actinomadura logoneensis]
MRGNASLWRNRNFVLLWVGQTFSEVGTRMTSVAFPLLVLALTGSPARAGLSGFAGTLPYVLFYLPAGALVDRWDRRRVMLCCELGQFAALGSLAAAFALDAVTFPHILLTAFVSGSCFVFFSVSQRALLPALVPSERLTEALARQETKSRSAALTGSPLGGLLFGLGHALPFVADAASYLVSVATILGIRTRHRPAPPPRETATGLYGEIREGMRWLWHEPFVRMSVALTSAVNLMFQALILTLIVLAGRLGAGSAGTGLILGCFGVGGLAGALVAPRVPDLLSSRAVAIGATWVWAATAPLLAVATNPYELAAVIACMAVVGPVWNVVVVGHQYKVVPDHLLGRVKSVALLTSWGSMPLGQLLGGYLLSLTAPRQTVLLLSLLSLAIALTTTLNRSMRMRGPTVGRPGLQPQ